MTTINTNDNNTTKKGATTNQVNYVILLMQKLNQLPNKLTTDQTATLTTKINAKATTDPSYVSSLIEHLKAQVAAQPKQSDQPTPGQITALNNLYNKLENLGHVQERIIPKTKKECSPLINELIAIHNAIQSSSFTSFLSDLTV